MERNYLFRKIELHFDELELLTDYLKDRSVETLRIVEELAGTLSRIKEKCRKLPSWALRTFEQTLEDHALRAMLMAGNAPLLQERRTIIETIGREVERVEKEQKEYYKQKEVLISVLNTLRALEAPSIVLESELKDLALSEKKMEKKKFGNFSQIEKEIESLLIRSHELVTRAEEEKKKSVTREKIDAIPEIQQYQEMISQLEELGTSADVEKRRIESHKKALGKSDCRRWSQIFYSLQEDLEALKRRIELAEELRNYLTELEHAGMDTSLSEARTLYETGDFLRAEYVLKSLKGEYEKGKEGADSRKKISETILQQYEKMLDDLPREIGEALAVQYRGLKSTLETNDVLSDDFLDQVQAFRKKVEDSLSRQRREVKLKEMASELREKVKKVNNDIGDTSERFEDIKCKKENIERFQEKMGDLRKEITAVVEESRRTKAMSEDNSRALSNRLDRIDMRIEDARRKIAFYASAYDSFVEYRESYMKLLLILAEPAREELARDLLEVEGFLREHLFDYDFPVETLAEKIKRAKTDMKEREIILKDSIRKVEKMKNELMAMKGDFALMGYLREEEDFEKKIEEIFEGKDIQTTHETIEEIGKQRNDLQNSMKECLHKNIGGEIEVLEKIRKEGDIERYESFVKDIIEITEKYDFQDLKARAEGLTWKKPKIAGKCPHLDCEADIEGDIQFCPACGRNLVLCPVCGKYNKMGSRFCPACGRLLGVEEFLMKTLEKEDSVSFQDLMEVHLGEEEAKQAIQAFFNNCSPIGEELFGNPIDMENFRIFVIRTSMEGVIRELLPLHGAISADDIEGCSPEDIVRFYEKFKDTAREELGYEIELIENMIVKK